RQTKHASEKLAVAVGDFRRAMQLEDGARGVVAPDTPARFQGNPGVAADGKLKLDDHRSGAQHRIHVAVALTEHGDFGVAAVRELARLRVSGEKNWQLVQLHGDAIGDREST